MYSSSLTTGIRLNAKSRAQTKVDSAEAQRTFPAGASWLHSRVPPSLLQLLEEVLIVHQHCGRKGQVLEGGGHGGEASSSARLRVAGRPAWRASLWLDVTAAHPSHAPAARGPPRHAQGAARRGPSRSNSPPSFCAPQHVRRRAPGPAPSAWLASLAWLTNLVAVGVGAGQDLGTDARHGAGLARDVAPRRLDLLRRLVHVLRGGGWDV